MAALKLNFKSIYFALIFTLFFSCNKEENNKLIDCIYLSRNKTLAISVFFENNDKIFYFSGQDFVVFYNNNKMNISYKEYIKKALYEKDFIKPLKSTKLYKINHAVEKEYSKLTLVEFINKYCKTKDKSRYLLKNDISDDEKITVMYLMSKKDIYFSFDDYAGFYIGRKISDSVE